MSTRDGRLKGMTIAAGGRTRDGAADAGWAHPVFVLAALSAFALAALAAWAWPRAETVKGLSGRTYEVTQLARVRGIGAMFAGRAPGLRDGIVVTYYGADSLRDVRAIPAAEVADMSAHALPLARRTGDSLVVLRRVYPVFSRLIPYVEGTMLPVLVDPVSGDMRPLGVAPRTER